MENHAFHATTHRLLVGVAFSLLLAAVTLALPGQAYAAAVNLAGDYANQTSACISAEAFPEGSEWVIVARDDDFKDSMSASGLAGTLNCPIVITDSKSLSNATKKEIERLGATRCYIIGGTSAVSSNVFNQIKALGLSVKRVWGDCSWDTSVACAQKIAEHGGNPYGYAIVTSSINFQDALSISPFAYKYQVPIFLETQSGDRPLPNEAITLIKNLSGDIFVPGGPSAVAKSTVESVFKGRTVNRIWGDNAYDTSNQVATWMTTHNDPEGQPFLSASTTLIACGAAAVNGVDGLSGAALAGKNGGTLLLVNGNIRLGYVQLETIRGTDSTGTTAFLEANRAAITTCYTLGGNYVIPHELTAIINDPNQDFRPDPDLSGMNGNAFWNAVLEKYYWYHEVQQILLVKYVEDSDAVSQFWVKDADGDWSLTFEEDAYVGRNGAGTASAYSSVTPMGDFAITEAFGICDNPGTALPYIQVTDTVYGSCDCSEDCPYFNTIHDVAENGHWECSGEHMIDYSPDYDYGLNFDYNPNKIYDMGSAFFVHCKNDWYPYTGGCIALDYDNMITTIQMATPGMRLVVDNL